MENVFMTTGYAVYLVAALSLTYFVASNLFKNSKVFMLDIFKGNSEIALSTNRLFEIGFYLLNIGFALLILKIHSYHMVDNSQILIEILSFKIGGFSIYLGIMLFLNLYMFFRGRKASRRSQKKAEIEQIVTPPGFYDSPAI